MEDFIQPSEENPIEPIDISIFKEHIQKSLINIIHNLPKVEKRLVLENSLIPKLSFFINDISLLINEQVKKEIFKLGKEVSIDSEIMIFLIPGKINFLKEIFSIIENNESTKLNNNQTMYHIIFIPKIDNECQINIKTYKYNLYIKIHNLNMDIFTLDYDLMSLEENNTIRDIYINKNYNCLSILSRVIVKFQTVFGKIKYKYLKGNLSKKLYDLLDKDEEKSPFETDSEILASIFLDRDIDFVTPFCTQSTFEGMIDEYFNINLNSIKVSPKLLEKESKKETIKIDLSNQNKLYSMIKDYSFNKIRIFLPKRLQLHSKILEEGKKITDLTKIQIGLERVKLMKEERESLTNSINIADFISNQQKSPLYRLSLMFEQGLLVGELSNELHNFYDSLMGQKINKDLLLRLLCLESLTQSGIKMKFYDDFKRDYFNIFGYQEIFLWNNLEKMNILKKEDRNYFYYKANKGLNLISDSVNFLEPNNVSYSYGGYSPITIKLIENCVKNGWNNIKYTLNDLPGETFFPDNEKDILNIKEKSFILLVFIGGITYGEIACIRYLNKELKNVKFIILTTHIITNKRLIDSLSTFNCDIKEQMTFKEFYEMKMKKK